MLFLRERAHIGREAEIVTANVVDQPFADHKTDFPGKDEAYYLRGNAYRKQGNWQQALNNYQYAIDLNPESPAQHAYQMAMDILNFYNKDMYNQ